MADIIITAPDIKPSFFGYFLSIAPAASKYMATIFNTSSTRKVVMQRMSVILNSVASVAGVTLLQSLVFITAQTPGSTFIIDPEDTNDVISPGITITTGNTGVVATRTILNFIVSSEEPTTAFTNLQLGAGSTSRIIYERKEGSRGLTLRQNQGLSIQNLTASTVGQFAYLFEFTDEPA